MLRSIRPRFLRLLLAAGMVSPATGQDLDELQESAREWIDLRLEASRLEAAWDWEKEVLEGTLQTLQDRRAALEEKVGSIEAGQAGKRRELDAKLTEVSTLRASAGELENFARAAGDQLNEMRPRLPPRLSLALSLAYESLADPGMGTADRLQVVATILSRCAAFNQKITYSEEAVMGPDGEARMMPVLYCGLSHAYALDEGQQSALFGRPRDGVWTWIEDRSLSPAVARLVAIFNEAEDPAVVPVPAHVN